MLGDVRADRKGTSACNQAGQNCGRRSRQLLRRRDDHEATDTTARSDSIGARRTCLGEVEVAFLRREAGVWHSSVPGARWFKADLHVHSIDDHPGGKAKMPSGVIGRIHSEATITAYARRFLQEAADRGIQVLGITPHSPRLVDSEVTSAVWRIVEEWQTGCASDGTPFRERIYAVFPGFEPSLNNGRSGLHLLFLFDPEIGLENYLTAFDLAMGGVSPWSDVHGNELQMSNRSAEEAFLDLRDFHMRECKADQYGRSAWNYIVLAPHIDSDKGLLEAQRAQVLQLFQHSEVSGLELGDNKLPSETLEDRPWLVDGMSTNRQSFFHSSDAYAVHDIGRRHVWIKIASPSIEALRQAFLAGDSRIRIGYNRGSEDQLLEISKPPDVTMNDRPWLKSVAVAGKASFFGSVGDNGNGSQFHLSPDLTCIIGGSMTGKSTFLDGLRVHVSAPLPEDSDVREQVIARGRYGFLGGSATVTLECPGKDPTAALHEQWPAVFYTQTELQRLAQSPDAVDDVLARLVASETASIHARDDRMNAVDRELSKAAKNIGRIEGQFAESEQAFERSQRASAELNAFSDAGVDDLIRTSSERRRWAEFETLVLDIGRKLDGLAESFESVEVPPTTASLLSETWYSSVVDRQEQLRARWADIHRRLSSVTASVHSFGAASRAVLKSVEGLEDEVRIRIDRRLAAHGFDAASIGQLQALNVQASLLESYRAHRDQAREALASAGAAFETLLSKRRILVRDQRIAFDGVIAKVHCQFEGRIIARRIDEDRKEELDKFLRQLSQRGITRWWNDVSNDQRPGPDELLGRIDCGQLAQVGMSAAVQETFRLQMTPPKRRELAALRCRDRYVLEFEVDDGSYRRLRDLSGGQRVSLLLSLLLETSDDRPLVIDQPEDELDNRFLFETMLPALKRLKGRRQIILATHKADIVVNGDADQVIQLEATSDRGYVACSGAIEDPAVRNAIVRTVDGGDEAFRLRRLKYGF